MLPTTLAVGTTEKVAVVVSTPADAIVAAPYAKAMGYNLIYTPTHKLSEDAERELIRGGYTKAIIIGGPVAVSETVENSIRNLKIKTERIWGETRVETSIEVYKRLKKEKPELTGNVVITQGFNEKISPVAVSFNVPVLYYGLNRENKVVEVLKNTRIKNAVILGEKIPQTIMTTVPKISENTFIASGSVEDVIKTAISYVKKINPGVRNKDVLIVYAERDKEPIIKGILNFLKDDVGVLIPLPLKSTEVLDKILSRVVEISYNVLVVSDDPKISEIILDTVRKLGPVSVSVISERISGGVGGDSGTWRHVSTPTGPVVTVIANGKKIEFMGQDKNTLKIDGNFSIHVPKVEAKVKVVDKEDKKHNLTIDFRNNESLKSVIEAMNNFSVVAYVGNKVNITYYNPKMKGKNVSLHVITERRALRNDINNLLKGDAQGLIERLNSSYNETKTVGSYGVEFTYKPSINGEHIVVITEGNGVPSNATYVKILAVGGFEVVKYKMNITYHGTNSITNQSNYTLSLNDTPDLPVRYGAVMIKKDATLTLEITGTEPGNNKFNVSVVGDKGKYQLVTNNHRIKLNAPKVLEIINKTLEETTASATYSDVTENKTETIVLNKISDSYLIAIAYEKETKKIVAIAEIEQ